MLYIARMITLHTQDVKKQVSNSSIFELHEVKWEHKWCLKHPFIAWMVIVNGHNIKKVISRNFF